MSSPWIKEARAALKLAIPVVTVQVGMMAMGVVDIAMIGRVSELELAATGLGHVYAFGLMIFGLGLLQSLDPLISQAVGAGDHKAIAHNLQRSIAVACALAIPVSLLAIPSTPLFEFLRQPSSAIPTATGYVHASIPGILPFFLFVVFRQTLQAFSLTRAIVTTIIVTNLINIALNWVFIFGNFGIEPMGAVGCAWATSICRWLMAGLLLLFGWRELRPHMLPLDRKALELQPLLRMIRLGAPIGTAMCLEYGAFMSSLLLMGWLGETEISGHQVAINLASLSFMFPVGIGAAAAVRVGYAVGRDDPEGAHRAAWINLGLGVAVMIVFAGLFLAIPHELASLYSPLPEVIGMAALLLPVAGFFQIFDGIQAIAAGILRGMGDTRTPMLVNLFGFWVLGLPLGYLLTFHLGVAPQGPWWGMLIGLAVVSVILLARVRTRLRGNLARVQV